MKDYTNYYPPFGEIVLENGRGIFEQQLLGTEGKDVLINDVQVRALVKYHTNPLNDERENRKLTCSNSVDLKKGSLVKIIDEDAFYLALSRVKTNDLVKYIQIYHCDQILTWQDGGGMIHSTPCILADKTSVYSDGLSKTKLISLGTDQISITIQSNDLTEKISLNKRFIFKSDGNNIYEVTRKDNMLNDGMITFVTKKSLYNPNTDNLELNIANYNGKFDPNPTEPEPEVPGEDTLKITGLERFTIWDEDEEYVINTEKEVEWSLDRDDLIHIVKVDGNKCYISSTSTNKIGKSILKAEIVGEPDTFTEMVISKFYQ